MAQRKALAYAQAKGAPAGFVLGLLGIASLARSVYASITTSAAVNHYLNPETGMVRIQAITNGIFVAFSADANKAPARATGTLTTDETEVADGTLVEVDDQVYRIKTTPSQANDIKIDSTADLTLARVAKAINGTGVEGTDYFAGTEACANVIASDVVAHVVTISAKLAGTDGNAIVLTSDDAHLAASGSGTLASGADGNFDDYVPAGQSKEITLDDSVSMLSFIGDGGTASASVVEY